MPFGRGPGPDPGPEGLAITAENVKALEQMLLDSGRYLF